MTRRSSAPSSHARDLNGAASWWIYIGHSADAEQVDWSRQGAGTDLVVLSGDPRIPLDKFPRKTRRLGYLSVGEADAHRGYWQSVREGSFLVEPNPSWPQNLRVDVRDARWQEVVVGQEAPRILAQGFDGLMLDTLDTAPYLEKKDPARFAGSRQALRELLGRLRQQFPKAVLLANGTESLEDAAPFVDGFVVEGVFATYDFGGWFYRQTTTEEREWKLAQIDRALQVARRPVFSIEYAAPSDPQLAGWATNEARQRGFRPFVTVKDLNLLPVR